MAELLTVKEASAVLGVSGTSLRRLIAEGEVPVIRLPGTTIMRLSRRWLERYVDQLAEAAEADQQERARAIEAEVAAMDSFLGRKVGSGKAG